MATGHFVQEHSHPRHATSWSVGLHVPATAWKGAHVVSRSFATKRAAWEYIKSGKAG